MDFVHHYTPKQESFRAEVRAWLDENVPDTMTDPMDPNDLTPEQYAFGRELAKKLAKKGWLAPTAAKEYGGGGMTAEDGGIIAEEIEAKQAVVVGGNAPASLIVWGSEEQKQRFLVPLMTGEKSSVTLLTEPKGGADLAGLETRAVRDGDDWLLTGTKCFISHRGDDFELLFGPAITDPDAPRHRNLGYFAIENPSPGLTIQNMNLLMGSEQHFIFMDNVRVPGANLIGGDHQGWQVAGAALEGLHGGNSLNAVQEDVVFQWGPAFPWKDMVSYLQDTDHDGESLGKDPLMEQLAMDCFMDGHVYTLFAKRNLWMYLNRKDLSYHTGESDVHRRQHDHRNMTRVRDIMGLYAQLKDDPNAPLDGMANVSQRNEMVSQHGAGSLNIAKVVMARRLNISRTQERMAAIAPPPPTAASS
jgi:alkylation response protein AidB-like acyl-CoA dehydrogenase